MRLLGFSIQIWFMSIIAVSVLIYALWKKRKGLTVVGFLLSAVCVAAIATQIGMWTRAENTKTPTPAQSEQVSEVNINLQPKVEGYETTTSTSTISVSRQNALRKAESYLSISAFSYTGLIEQLEFEQFPHDDAVYAADNCGANWYEQAAKKAASYMEISAFSRGSLIDQLEFEGFTAEQAAYGATSVGL